MPRCARGCRRLGADPADRHRVSYAPGSSCAARVSEAFYRAGAVDHVGNGLEGPVGEANGTQGHLADLRVTEGGRRLRLRLAERWPWSGEITAAVTRLQALPSG